MEAVDSVVDIGGTYAIRMGVAIPLDFGILIIIDTVENM